MNLSAFHLWVGETIMFCQQIEHDIKLTLAGMESGDFDENYTEIINSKMTLGTAIGQLQKIDNSDKKPHLSEGDYKLLFQVNGIRIHWAHDAYTTFLYLSGKEYDEEYSREARRLTNDHNRLSKLSEIIERVRLEVLRLYGRID